MLNDAELFKKTLGQRIAKIRQEKGLTQAALGARINRDYQSVSRIESGKINVSGFIIYQIAEALEVNVNLLFPD